MVAQRQAVQESICREWLLSRAGQPVTLATQAFAGVIAAIGCGQIVAPRMGLNASEFSGLLEQCFLSAKPDVLALPAIACAALPREDFNDLLQLLLEYRRDDSDETAWVAHALCSGCMGSDHLYSDMCLPNRQILSDLIAHYFPVLFGKNSGARMRWKKFFYKQLCDRAEVHLCPAPGCQSCIDRPVCFMPGESAGEADARDISSLPLLF